MINLFRFAKDVLTLGDMNADLGLGGGPMASTPINEQGKTSTYESEADRSISTIDHILCPSLPISRTLIPLILSCYGTI